MKNVGRTPTNRDSTFAEGSSAPGTTCMVIWDFDGTLVDSRNRNLSVTRTIVQDVTQKEAPEYEALASIESYDAAWAGAKNWRDLYSRLFGMSPDEVDRVGSLWSEYQLRDQTDMPVFEGIPDTLENLRHLPSGIVSQNGKRNISSALRRHNLGHYFRAIVGYEEVGLRRQKPAPDGLLTCIRSLSETAPTIVFCVGDHETDAVCAERARRTLQQEDSGILVVSIAALYGVEGGTSWAVSADREAWQPSDVADIISEYASAIS